MIKGFEGYEVIQAFEFTFRERKEALKLFLVEEGTGFVRVQPTSESGIASLARLVFEPATIRQGRPVIPDRGTRFV